MSMITLLKVGEKKVKNIITYTTETICFINLELTKKNIQAETTLRMQNKIDTKHKIQ